MDSAVEVLRLQEENAALKRRTELLEGQVVALSRTPALLGAVIKELKADNYALRMGAKRRFTEKQLRDSGEWNTEARSKAQLTEKTSAEELDELEADVEEAS